MCNGISCTQQPAMGVFERIIDRVFCADVVGAYRAYVGSYTGGDVSTLAEFVGIGRGDFLFEGSSVSLGKLVDGRLGVESVAASSTGASVAVGGGGGAAAPGGVASAVVGGGSNGVVGGVDHLCGSDESLQAGVDVGVSPKTLANRENRRRKAAAKRERKASALRNGVPVWRRGAQAVGAGGSAGLPSLSGSVNTVDTRTACEIEAADTLARRRVVENKIAIAKGEHLLVSLADKDKTEALARLDVARVEERINTVKARSQASFKKCASPLESIGSARSAGEFAWKQQVRKQEALQAEVDSLGKQLDKLLTIATPAQFNMLARLELPHIPTDEEIAAMDEDCSPYYTREEAEAEAAKYGVF